MNVKKKIVIEIVSSGETEVEKVLKLDVGMKCTLKRLFMSFFYFSLLCSNHTNVTFSI